MSECLLSLQHLSVDYKIRNGSLSAVNDVTLDIRKGEILAIVGESGCGKSTLAHSIMQLIPGKNATISGKIVFRGEDISKYNRKQIEAIRGKDIGMIFQNPLDSLNPVYRSGTQVQEAMLLDGIDKITAWNRVIDLFKDVKMPDPETCARSFPHELSGGMRQRVMIAMMISRNPQLLIADEPTTALDVTIQAQILEILKNLKQTYQTSIMLITHNLAVVAETADTVAVMYAGEVVEYGTVFDIFEQPQHPYTVLLIKALPRKTKAEGRLQTIDGNVPRITEKNPGCRFSNRCPYATEKCKTNTPPEIRFGETHKVRCFRVEE